MRFSRINSAIGVSPEKVQAHDDDDDARDNRELARIGAQQCTDDAGAGAQRHEDRGESEHEQQRRRHGFAANPRLGLGIGKPLQRGAGHIDEIRRHQRQHAGREKAQHAGGKRGGDRDLHGALNARPVLAHASAASASPRGCDGLVIPGPRQRVRPEVAGPMTGSARNLEIHTLQRRRGNSRVMFASFVVMDSGLADFVRAPE